uniref:30S ribosomal protein S15 n=2 Tax=Eutreptiella gymnastica TaxID=73025 RepID=A0A7S1HTJ2_9EUGL
MTANQVVAQLPRVQPLYAGNEDEDSLAELLARSQELLQADDMDSSQVQTLDDDDVEIPSKGQLKRIRRMGHVDVSAFQKHDKDTGSAEVQVVRITARVASLADHLKVNKKDFAATRRIMELTSERRKLLNYLWRRDPGAVVNLVQDLQIRWRTPDKIARLIPRSGPVDILIPENPMRPRTIPKANVA